MLLILGISLFYVFAGQRVMSINMMMAPAGGILLIADVVMFLYLCGPAQKAYDKLRNR